MNDAIVSIDEIVDENTYTSDKIQLVVDRAVVRVDDEDNDYRLQDSIQTAFYEGRGACELRFMYDRLL